MKPRTMALAVLALALLCGGMARAQDVAPNPTAEREFENWVNRHQELRNNPGLIRNQSYLAAHPAFAGFLRTHPYVHQQALENSGAWDSDNHWHTSNWWRQNNPNWVQQNRPIWMQNRSMMMNRDGDMANNDGDWDEGHHWRKRQWWIRHRRVYAQQHHPGWFQQGDHNQGPHGRGHDHGHGHDND